ncbi:PIG-L family deacetylase [Dactylosporangium sp. CA-139114]|uniref:PIG-L family deacetylase n=1 Tax=Dactylosporangium sp. CA-139114 TaxID=3239931 RepID=UPI003D98F1CA
MPKHTIVSFHAHPDDESLLTGGTLARAAAEGHRVVLVTATLGEAGLASSSAGLGSRRHAELMAAASALGCARVETLGYADSGLAGGAGFASVPVDEAAARLAAILTSERADVLTGYDANGGYGHPDHVQVHRVARAASALTGTPLLEATVDRASLRALLAVLRVAGRFLPSLPFGDPSRVFTAREDITHVVDVKAYEHQKRAAMRAHVSQSEGGSGIRTLALLSRLPGPLFRAVCGREWFTAPGHDRGKSPLGDIFSAASSHSASPPRRSQ